MKSTLEEDAVILQSNEFQCGICLEIAKNAVEMRCCHQLFCERCISRVPQCPTCRTRPIQVLKSCVVRRLISRIPTKCMDCGGLFERGNMGEHKARCPRKVVKCIGHGCRFEGIGPDSLVEHMIAKHWEALARNSTRIFDPPLPLESISCQLPLLADLVEVTHNSRGARVNIGDTGKYYCGQKMLTCPCCNDQGRNGACGPHSGCNCLECMELDVRARRLPRGYLVNGDGMIAKLAEDGQFYCNRLFQFEQIGGVTKCVSDSACLRCIILSQTQARYKDLM